MKSNPKLPDPDVNVSEEPVLKEVALLTAGAVGFAAVVATILGYFVNIFAPFIPLGAERAMWAGAQPYIESTFQEHDPLLDSLVAELAEHWTENPYDLRVRVFDAEETNAFALPGGVIVVTTGLLQSMGSVNELAFVLGHEIGHFKNRDHLKSLGRTMVFRMVLFAVGGGAPTMSQLFGESGLLSDRSFGRRQERKADRVGLSLVVSEFGHGAGALDFFEKMRTTALDPGSGISEFWSTHPGFENRMEVLEAYAREQNYRMVGERVPFEGRLRPEELTSRR